MKKILALTLVITVITIVPVWATTWYPLDSKGVQWIAPTVLTSGNPIPADNMLKYHVYLRRDGTITETRITDQPIEATQYYITITEEGRYWVGVQVLRYLSDGTLVGEPSEIAWTDDPTVVAAGETWGISFYFPTAKPSDIAPL